MISASRLLGFAFSSSDLLLEIDGSGMIAFALGAAGTTAGRAEPGLVGSPASSLFAGDARRQFSVMLADARPGKRLGPRRLALKNGALVQVSLCNLPGNDNVISCSLKIVDPAAERADASGHDPETGLLSPESFFSDLTGSVRALEELALIEIPALGDACARLSPVAARALLMQIGAAIKNGARAATRIGDSKFGCVSTRKISAIDLVGRVGDAVAAQGLPDLHVDVNVLDLCAGRLSPEQRILAVRHVVGRFAAGASGGESLPAVFEALVGETVERARSLAGTISGGHFSLAFDAIVDLKSRVIVHHEALSRFKDTASPAETIRFAEQMDLAAAVDIAVATKVFDELESEAGRGLTLALNISGASIGTRQSFAVLQSMFERKRNLARRVLIEITETEAIADPSEANRVVQDLRQAGFRVGLDDFGAGAASLQYLHAFEVDFVKFDGSLIRRVGKSERSDALLRGLVGLCKLLGVTTVAEWIDDENKAVLAQGLGFDLGQGRLFGLGLARPRTEPAIRGRREGEKVIWA